MKPETVRQDFNIYNGTSMVTLQTLASLSSEADEIKARVQNGEAVSLHLEDEIDSVNVRVVIGQELNEPEKNEWVGKVSWGLNVQHGELWILGGRVAPPSGDAVQLKLSPGFYHLNLYTFVPSVNSFYCLKSALGGEEQLNQWAQGLELDPEVSRYVEMLVELTPSESPAPKNQSFPENFHLGFPANTGCRVPPVMPKGIPAEITG